MPGNVQPFVLIHIMRASTSSAAYKRLFLQRSKEDLAMKAFSTGLSVTVIVLFVGSSISWHKLGAQVIAEDCELVHDGLNLKSPQKDKVAILEHEICAGGFGNGSEEHRIRIKSSNQLNNVNEIVFQEFGSFRAPELTWTDAETLNIHIVELANIVISLSKLDDVRITYSISKTLSRVDYKKKIEHDKENLGAKIESGIATFTGDKIKDRQILKNSIAREYEDYNHFATWVELIQAKVGN